jgi:cytochrome c-type biogenesis protein CcmE
MTPKRKQRLFFVVAIILGMGVTTALSLYAFREGTNFFYGVSQVVAGEPPPGASFRVGGLVVPGTVRREPGSLQVRFDLTDNEKVVTVAYAGILPDLFREGQGIIARGTMNDAGEVEAVEVLAKHDEEYMPPEVAESLKSAGTWQHGQPGATTTATETHGPGGYAP